MRTRRSWRNQDRLYKAIGRDLARAAQKEQIAMSPTPQPTAPPQVVTVLHIRQRSWMESTSVYATRPAAVEALRAFTAECENYEPDSDVATAAEDRLIELCNSHEHSIILEDCEVHA